jgi:addiction module HigA family antidote
MTMHSPSHPGTLLRAALVEDDEGNSIHTIEEVAAMLEIHRTHLSRILNCHARVTAEVALKLEDLDKGRADFWMAAQAKYDLAEARKARNTV